MRGRAVAAVLLAAALWGGGTSEAAAQGCLVTPAPANTVTSIYGWRFHPVFRQWRIHRGVDLRTQGPVALKATHGGTVQVAFSASGGNEVRIVGDSGLVTRYLHLTRAAVRPGDEVTAGQLVAISGNTGHASTAHHLHLEVQMPEGGIVNPEPLLCPSANRVAGADRSGAFPIRACNPVTEGCDGGAPGDLPPLPGGTPSGSVGLPPTAPRIAAWDDMSTAEILASEVAKRFGNPAWYQDIQSRGMVPLLVESAHMRALRATLRAQELASRERIELMLAARVARRNAQVLDAPMQRQRASASRSAGAGR